MDVGIKVQAVANAVEALALHNFSAGGSEEPLVFSREGGVEEIGHHSIENSIAQKLETLIVGPSPVGEFHRFGAMHHRKLVEPDVSRVVTGDVVYKNIKLLILDEKELYE